MINGAQSPYVRAAIQGEIARLSSALEGERNTTLFKATAALASLGLREGEILHHLKPVAENVGLHGQELYATVKSGVRAGSAHPRGVPEQRCSVAAKPKAQPAAIAPVRSLPPRSLIDSAGWRPAFHSAGDEGPRVSPDEIRRHIYRRGQIPVRVKIKRMNGSYTNWYRVASPEGDGWQAAKPDGYVPCPFVGALDPFDPELSSDVLYWPEGEKDCERLGNAALPAFTFGGTGDGLPEGISAYLRERHVVILADNDSGGKEHALKKAALCHSVAASVKIVEFPELPLKGDVSDYLASASIEEFERRCSTCPLWAPATAPTASSSAGGGSWRRTVISACDLKAKNFKPVSYVVPGYIPEGVTVFAGKPKVGKSWLLYDVCLASAADRFVLGTIKPVQGDVLYLALEDSQRRLKTRLNKLCPAGTWPARLQLATEWRRADMGGIDDLAEWCTGVTQPVLIVIDTLEKFRQLAKPGSSAHTTDYLAIAALHKLAHERGIAIVVIHHVRKMEADDPFDMVSGTNGLTGAADTILVLKRQAGNVTLYARGRDIEEKETACQFDKATCRWTLLGDAGAVYNSGEREAIVAALRIAGADGMHIAEIMAATERNDRNAVDQLLFKMQRDGAVTRVKRGVYAVSGKIGKKERNICEAADTDRETVNLTDLTDLTEVATGETRTLRVAEGMT